MRVIVNPNQTVKKQFKKLLAAFASAFVIAAGASANPGAAIKAPKDTIVINKLLVSKKYRIKIFPGTGGQFVFFTASGEAGKVYQLYVFDFDGNLVKQTQIRNRETTLLTNFNKGNYSFDVFSDDERIENGTMSVH